MRRWMLILIPALLLLGGGAGLWWWLGEPPARHFYTDAESIRQPVAQARPRDVLWQPPRPLSELFETSEEDYEPKLSWDGLTLFFVRGKAGQNAEIYTSRRTPRGWEAPRPLEEINSAADELGPEPSRDGARLFFYSNREGGHGGYDLWVADWADGAWQTPANLGPAVNSRYNDYGPALAPTGERLYFASNRPQPQDTHQPQPDAWPATVREDLFHRTYDLYEALRTPAGFAPAQALTSLNTPYNEGAPGASPGGDFLYFASDRPGGAGGFDLYRARRINGAFLAPESLGEPVNSSANDLDPGLSALGYALFFSSDRPLAEPDASAAHRRDADAPRSPVSDASHKDAPAVTPSSEPPYRLYHTAAREVFLDAERVGRPPIDWAALLQALWPSVMWLVLALLALLLLLGLWRDMKKRRLSLMARCLLASLMLHLLALMLSSLWKVGSAVAGLARGDGPIHVALSPAAGSGDLSLQIHGALSDVSLPSIESPALAQHDLQFSQPIEAARAELSVSAAALAAAEHVNLPQPERESQPQPAPGIRVSLHDPARERASLDISAPRPPAATAAPEPVVESARAAQPVAGPRSGTVDFAVAGGQPVSVEVAGVDLSALGERSLAPAGGSALEARPHVGRSAAPPAVNLAVGGSSLPIALPAEPGRTAAAEERGGAPVAAATSAAPRAEVGVLTATSGAPTESFTVAAPPAAAIDVPGSVSASSAMGARIEASPAPRIHPSGPPATGSVPRGQFALRLPDSTAKEGQAGPVAEAGVSVAAAALNDGPRAGLLAPDAVRAAPVVLDVASSPARLADVGAALPAPAVQPAARETRPDLPRLASGALEPTSRSHKPTLALALPAIPDHEAFGGAGTAQNAGNESGGPHVAAVDTTGLLSPKPLATASGFTPSTAHAVPVAPSALSKDDLTRLPNPALKDVPPGLPALGANAAPAAGWKPAAHELALGLPPAVERTPLTDAFSQREPQRRPQALKEFGGNRRTEEAVEKALAWLARHQSSDGRWDGQQFDEQCSGCGGATANELDVAVTGLTLLSFLAGDHTHVAAGPYQSQVRRAIDWLLAGQKPDGDLRRGDTLYAQGIATLALCEAYAMTGDETLADPARRAVQYIIAAQHPRTGGWRFQPGDEGDTSVLGWQILALRSAAIAGISVPPHTLAGAKRWLMLVEDRSRPGLYAYLPGESANEAMTAEGLLTQQLIGQPLDDPRTLAAVEALSSRPPQWSQGPSTYAWFFATQALFHNLGEPWQRWNRALRRELLEHQERGGPAEGSWPPEGDGAVGGRVYQTALCALMLQTYYRYAPLQAREYSGPGIGALEGHARSAETRAPLAGATIRLDLPGGEPLTATTDEQGHYALVVPEVPDHFALSASHAGYVPQSRNVSALELRGRTLRVDFDLMPENVDVVALEAEPEVHHLGNDRFEGRINSQFQRVSEGDLYVGRFTLSAEQAASASALLTVMAKGVQCPHEVRLNGELLERRLDQAPDDGSFGEIRFALDVGRLRAGENELSIQTVSCRGDLDDFEFVNLVIRLERAGP